MLTIIPSVSNIRTMPISHLNAAVEIKMLGPDRCRPTYGSDQAAGLDLRANIESTIRILPDEKVSVPCGFALNMKSDAFAAYVYPRSGLGIRGLVLANSTGLIDADYQGEIFAVLWNRNGRYGDGITIEPFDRIAQLVFQPIVRATLEEVQEFSSTTNRGSNGLGSTGVK